MNSKKIAIIGGGIAGCMAGLELQARDPEKKLEITIYERSKEIHTTLCGEGLSQDTLDRFNQVFDSNPYIAQSFKGAKWKFPKDTTFVVHQPCHTMARSDWIPAMAKAFEERGGHVQLERGIKAEDFDSLGADVIIGADGPGSVVQRAMGAKITLRTGIQYRIKNSDYQTDWLEFYTDKKYTPEYAWIFPRGDMVNAGSLGDAAQESWDKLDLFLEDYGCGGTKFKREAYPIGFGGTKVQEGNKFLIGDAAGLTNPLTKGGMAAIIYAAEILADCITQDRFADYQKEIFQHPITSPSFQKALEWIESSSNAEVAKFTRLFPKEMHVGPGQPKFPYLWRIALTAVTSPHKIPLIATIYKSLSLSRRYSW